LCTMGKEGKEAHKDHKDKAKAPEAKPAAEQKKKQKGKVDTEPQNFLSKLRKTRVVFFITFLAFCAWIVLLYNPCDVKKKDRTDCGYPDITRTECLSLGCFKKGGGKVTKINANVTRPKGISLGLDISMDEASGWGTINDIKAGAVKEYNDKLPASSPDRILVGDKVAKLDGYSGKGFQKALDATTAKNVFVDIRRSSLPSYLRWLSAKGKPNAIEKILTSPGTKQWSESFSYIGGVGLVCWVCSGYSFASIPLYYFSLSAAVAFQTTRCCHDDQVSGGTPHCYKGGAPFWTVVSKAWERTQQMAAQFRKDPKSYFKGFKGLLF